MSQVINALSQLPFGKVVLVVGIIVAGLAIRYAFYFLTANWLKLRRLMPPNLNLHGHFSISLLLAIYAGLIHLTLPLFDIPQRLEGSISRVSQIVFIVGITWFLMRMASLAELVFYTAFDTSVEDNIRQRAMRTQIQFVIRMIIIVLGILGFSAVLLSFDGARRLGASLIASAGVASVVLGFAAQKSLANLIAGFQIAFTQPVRIDDVVIVEKEWGRVEEITLTYVVVKLWDLRRMILPITYFVEKPFENWTRTSAEILGYAMIYADYRVPVEEVRAELERVVQKSPLWNKRVCGLQVTDTKDNVIEMRCLVSARNASDAFDLRCVIREEIIKFIQTKYPDSLPRLRAELSNSPDAKNSPPAAP